MKRSFAAFVFLMSLSTAALAASGRQPAPPGSFEGAPPQYTRFSAAEIMRGFLALSLRLRPAHRRNAARHPPLRSSDPRRRHSRRQRRSRGGNATRPRRICAESPQPAPEHRGQRRGRRHRGSADRRKRFHRGAQGRVRRQDHPDIRPAHQPAMHDQRKIAAPTAPSCARSPSSSSTKAATSSSTAPITSCCTPSACRTTTNAILGPPSTRDAWSAT